MIREEVIVVHTYSGKHFRTSDVNYVEMIVHIFLKNLNLTLSFIC
jgi:hypothetical protein